MSLSSRSCLFASTRRSRRRRSLAQPRQYGFVRGNAAPRARYRLELARVVSPHSRQYIAGSRIRPYVALRTPDHELRRGKEVPRLGRKGAEGGDSGWCRWGSRDRRNRQTIDDDEADGTHRECRELVSHVVGAERAPDTIPNLDPILRRDLPVEPRLNELARRRDQTRQQRVVGRRKGTLPRLQPRLDISERRQVTETCPRGSNSGHYACPGS